MSTTGNNNDLLGVIVSYSIKVKVILGGMGGELETDLPFKLVHPKPDSIEMENLLKEKTSAREQMTESRRRMFQGQDSVLNESFHASQAGITEDDYGSLYARLFLVGFCIFTTVYTYYVIKYLQAKFYPEKPDVQLEESSSMGSVEAIFTVVTSIFVAAVTKAFL